MSVPTIVATIAHQLKQPPFVYGTMLEWQALLLLRKPFQFLGNWSGCASVVDRVKEPAEGVSVVASR